MSRMRIMKGPQRPRHLLRWGQRTLAFLVVSLGWMWVPHAGADPLSVTNPVVSNVTPGSFNVVWRGDPRSSLAIYPDAGASTNISAQLCFEHSAIRTGDPSKLSGSHERRLSQIELSDAIQQRGLRDVRVYGCKPGTTYYIQVLSGTGVSGSDSPIFAVQTLPRNSFIPNGQQLVLTLPGDPYGRLIAVTHSNAAYAVTAYVGDGGAKNQVVFNLSELVNLTKTGNFTPVGSQDFKVAVVGAPSNESQEFTLAMDDVFGAGGNSLFNLDQEFVQFTIGSTVIRLTESGSVPLTINSSVPLSALTIAFRTTASTFSGLKLDKPAASLDAATSVVTGGANGVYQITFKPKAGQNISGQQVLGQLAWSTTTLPDSSFVPLTITSITGQTVTQNPLANPLGKSGRVVLVGRSPLLEASLLTDHRRRLTLYGQTTNAYALISSPSPLAAESQWQFVSRVVITNGLQNDLDDLPDNVGTRYFGAYIFTGEPPLLELQASGGAQRKLVLYGVTGQTYTVLYATNLNPQVTWRPLLNYKIVNPNGIDLIQPPAVASDKVFYKLSK